MSVWKFDPAMGVKFEWQGYELAVMAEVLDAAGVGVSDVILLYRPTGTLDWMLWNSIWNNDSVQPWESYVAKFGTFAGWRDWFIASLNQHLAKFVAAHPATTTPTQPTGDPKNITEFGAWLAGGNLIITSSPTMIAVSHK